MRARQIRRVLWLCALAMMFGLAGCEAIEGDEDVVDVNGDAGAGDGSDDAPEEDADSGPALPASLGFALRTPGARTLTCSGAVPEERRVTDADHVCAISHSRFSGYVYVQASGSSCRMS